jgi:hypothetical protein
MFKLLPIKSDSRAINQAALFGFLARTTPTTFIAASHTTQCIFVNFENNCNDLNLPASRERRWERWRREKCRYWRCFVVANQTSTCVILHRLTNDRKMQYHQYLLL